jgi:hypothetical protein
MSPLDTDVDALWQRAQARAFANEHGLKSVVTGGTPRKVYIALYVSESSRVALKDWCEKQGFDLSVNFGGEQIETFDFHCTIACSINDVALPDMDMPIKPLLAMAGGNYGLPVRADPDSDDVPSLMSSGELPPYKVLGENTPVLCLWGDQISLIREFFIQNFGINPTYADFKPHISLSYNWNGKPALKDLPKEFPFRIEFDRLVIKEFKYDKKSDAISGAVSEMRLHDAMLAAKALADEIKAPGKLVWYRGYPSDANDGWTDGHWRLVKGGGDAKPDAKGRKPIPADQMDVSKLEPRDVRAMANTGVGRFKPGTTNGNIVGKFRAQARARAEKEGISLRQERADRRDRQERSKPRTERQKPATRQSRTEDDGKEPEGARVGSKKPKTVSEFVERMRRDVQAPAEAALRMPNGPERDAEMERINKLGNELNRDLYRLITDPAVAGDRNSELRRGYDDRALTQVRERIEAWANATGIKLPNPERDRRESEERRAAIEAEAARRDAARNGKPKPEAEKPKPAAEKPADKKPGGTFYAVAPDGSVHKRTSKTRNYSHAIMGRDKEGSDTTSWGVVGWASSRENAEARTRESRLARTMEMRVVEATDKEPKPAEKPARRETVAARRQRQVAESNAAERAREREEARKPDAVKDPGYPKGVPANAKTPGWQAGSGAGGKQSFHVFRTFNWEEDGSPRSQTQPHDSRFSTLDAATRRAEALNAVAKKPAADKPKPDKPTDQEIASARKLGAEAFASGITRSDKDPKFAELVGDRARGKPDLNAAWSAGYSGAQMRAPEKDAATWSDADRAKVDAARNAMVEAYDKLEEYRAKPLSERNSRTLSELFQAADNARAAHDRAVARARGRAESAAKKPKTSDEEFEQRLKDADAETLFDTYQALANAKKQTADNRADMQRIAAELNRRLSGNDKDPMLEAARAMRRAKEADDGDAWEAAVAKLGGTIADDILKSEMIEAFIGKRPMTRSERDKTQRDAAAKAKLLRENRAKVKEIQDFLRSGGSVTLMTRDGDLGGRGVRYTNPDDIRVSASGLVEVRRSGSEKFDGIFSESVDNMLKQARKADASNLTPEGRIRRAAKIVVDKSTASGGKKEFGVSVLPDGTMIESASGGDREHSIAIDKSVTPELYKGKDRSIEFHHNHPTSHSFSPNDFAFGQSMDKLGSLYAHGNDGKSLFKMTYRQPPIAYKKAKKLHANMRKAFQAEIDAVPADTPDRRTKLLDVIGDSNHVEAIILARAGLIDYTWKFGRADRDARHKRVMEFFGDRIDAIAEAVRKEADVSYRWTRNRRNGSGVERSLDSAESPATNRSGQGRDQGNRGADQGNPGGQEQARQRVSARSKIKPTAGKFPTGDALAETKAVRGVLESATRALSIEDVAAHFTQGQKVKRRVGLVISAMANLGQVRQSDDGETYFIPQFDEPAPSPARKPVAMRPASEALTSDIDRLRERINDFAVTFGRSPGTSSSFWLSSDIYVNTDGNGEITILYSATSPRKLGDGTVVGTIPPDDEDVAGNIEKSIVAFAQSRGMIPRPQTPAPSGEARSVADVQRDNMIKRALDLFEIRGFDGMNDILRGLGLPERDTGEGTDELRARVEKAIRDGKPSLGRFMIEARRHEEKAALEALLRFDKLLRACRCSVRVAAMHAAAQVWTNAQITQLDMPGVLDRGMKAAKLDTPLGKLALTMITTARDPNDRDRAAIANLKNEELVQADELARGLFRAAENDRAADRINKWKAEIRSAAQKQTNHATFDPNDEGERDSDGNLWRKKNGTPSYEVDRDAPPDTEATIEMVTPDGSMTVRARPVIVDLDDLRAAEGDLQPRDRNRAESDAQIRQMASRLDPKQLMAERTTDRGAPLADGENGTVISGNGRIAAIRRAYDNHPDVAKAYKDAIDPKGESGFKRPVLVMQLDPMSQDEKRKLADLSNRQAIASMSATESGIRDAKAAGPEIMELYQGGDFDAAPNQRFLRAFMDAAVTDSERAAFSKDGKLTKQGVDRLNSAVMAAAYSDPVALSMMLESTDDNIKSISGAMRDVSAKFVRLKAKIGRNDVPDRFDMAPHLVAAAGIIADLRRRGVSPRNYFDQMDAFAVRVPEVEAFIRMFYDANLTRAKSRQAITDMLNRIADEALQKKQDGLLPDETQAIDVIRHGSSDTTGSLFGGPGDSGERAGSPSPRGTGRGQDGRREETQVRQVAKETLGDPDTIDDVGEKIGGARKDTPGKRRGGGQPKGMRPDGTADPARVDLRLQYRGTNRKLNYDAEKTKEKDDGTFYYYFSRGSRKYSIREGLTQDQLNAAINNRPFDTPAGRVSAVMPKAPRAEGDQKLEAWDKYFISIESVIDDTIRNGVSIPNPHKGKYFLHIAPKGGRGGMVGRQIAGPFDTQEAADAMKVTAYVGVKHSVISEGDKYAIYRRVTDRKRVKVVDQLFDTRDDAMRHMAENAREIIETKKNFGEEILTIERPDDQVRRIGPKVRDGDARPEAVLKDFGLRGVEFGNWNNQNERQRIVNEAYDGLQDLAEVIGLDPKQLGLNGELGLAFGARGHGLSGARAHYERSYGAINLTKMKGSGSLAHEWIHGLDHYLLRQSHPEYRKTGTDESGNRVFTNAPHLLSNARPRRNELPENVQQAFNKLIKGLTQKEGKVKVDTDRVEKRVEAYRGQLERSFQGLRDSLAREEPYNKRKARRRLRSSSPSSTVWSRGSWKTQEPSRA